MKTKQDKTNLILEKFKEVLGDINPQDLLCAYIYMNCLAINNMNLSDEDETKVIQDTAGCLKKVASEFEKEGGE